MKRMLVLFVMVPILGFSQLKGIDLGTDIPLPDKKLEAALGGEYSLKQLMGKNGLLVIFSSNTCPFVKVWEKDYPSISSEAYKQGIGMALINSNQKFRDGVDSKSEMARVQNEFQYTNIPYLVDDQSILANAFDANTTPHIFLFSSNGKLVYRGSIDNRYETKDKSPSEYYLLQAINQLSKGEQISTPISKNYGCSIKRK